MLSPRLLVIDDRKANCSFFDISADSALRGQRGPPAKLSNTLELTKHICQNGKVLVPSSNIQINLWNWRRLCRNACTTTYVRRLSIHMTVHVNDAEQMVFKQIVYDVIRGTVTRDVDANIHERMGLVIDASHRT